MNDRAEVLKNRVNNSPSPVTPPETQFGKHASAVGSAVVSGIGNKLSQLPKAKNAIMSGLTDKANRVARYFGGTTAIDLEKEKKKLDSSISANTFAPSTLTPSVNSSQKGGGPGPSTPGPAQLTQAMEQKGTARFDPTKLTLGNNEYTGEVGMFKDGKQLDSGSVRLSGGNLGGTPLPAGQSPFFMKSEAAKGLTQPQPQTGIPGATASPTAIPGSMGGGDWTNAMNQETAMLNQTLNPKLKPGEFMDWGKMGGQGSQQGGTGDPLFKDLESRISDLTNQNKQLMGGYGQSVKMGSMSNFDRQANLVMNNKSIKDMNNMLTNRSSLANDLVKALITAQSGKDTANIKAGTDLATTAMNNKALMDSTGMKEFGDMARAEALRAAAVPKENREEVNSKRQILKDRASALKPLIDAGDQNAIKTLQEIIDEMDALGATELDYSKIPGRSK
jgi:hypothetical protein